MTAIGGSALVTWASAAHDHEAVAVGIGSIEGHVGYIPDEIRGVLDSGIRDRLRREDVDLDGYVLQTLAALLSRHHHFVERLLRIYRSGHRSDNHQGQNPPNCSCHLN